MDNVAAKRRKNTRGIQLHCENLCRYRFKRCCMYHYIVKRKSPRALSLSLGFIYVMYVIFLFNENSFSERNEKEDPTNSFIQNQ